MAKQSLQVVLVGAGGNMRNAHVPRILEDKRTKIVGVADPEEEHADQLKERVSYDIPYFSNWLAMLKNVECDGVIISTPHKHHNLQVKRCLEAGLNVLVEKPLVIQPNHANSLVQLSRRVNRVLVVAYQRHFMREFVYARELIARGEIGEIRGISGYITQDWTSIDGWRLDVELSGGGMFMDTGSHLIASMLWVTNLHPKKVWASFNREGRKVDVNMACHMQFEGGALGSISTIGNAHSHDEALTITGSKGCISLRMHQWQLQSLTLNNKAVEVPRRIRATTPDAAFLNGIRKGADSVDSPDFTLDVAHLTAAAYKSISDNKPVPIRIPVKK